MPMFAFGQRPGYVDEALPLTYVEARQRAAAQTGPGYVWLYKPAQRHWHIVANYHNGEVWNGQAQCVPAPDYPAVDWER